MSDKSISYTSKAISADILSVLNVVADGKVVSATAWNTLWNAVFNSINGIDTYCMTINDITVDWANSKAELEQTISEFNRKHDALLNSFVHCGDEPPTNEHVRFWLKEVEETSPLATKADVAVVAAEVAHKADKDSLVGATTDTQGEIFNDYVNNVASGIQSHAEGNETIASGKYSHAEGYRNEANAEGSHAEGRRNKVTSAGKGSHIEGCDGEVSSSYAHVEGYGCKVTADRAHAECSENQVTGYAAHAEGSGTIASGSYTHTEGFKTEAKVDGAHSEGKFTKAESTAAHAEGNETTASGRYAHAEGGNTTASGESAHAEGHTSVATGDAAHAEGVGTQALGYGAHAEGSGTQALGQFTHAEGLNTVAQANNAHAEGNETQATGSSAHAEGCQTVASGAHSHAAGTGTIATYDSQTVVGTYNKESNALFIVGNGENNENRNNAFEVLKDGSIAVDGKVVAVDQTYSPASENAQSGKAVSEAVSEITDQNIIQDRKIQALEDSQANFVAQTHYDPESPLAQSGTAVAEAFRLKDFELLSDITITEDVAEVAWNTTDSGEPLTNYKDLFIYFLGKHTATASEAMYCRANDGGLYFMWLSFSKSTNIKSFWIMIEELIETDKIEAYPNKATYKGAKMYKTTFPNGLLGNVLEEGLTTQGLADNNRALYSDFTIGAINEPIEKLHIGQITSATSIFASGSRFLLLGRKA